MSYRTKMEQAESFEAKITAALEKRAEIAVPEGFAAKVAAGLPAVRPVRQRARLGRTVAMVVCALTMVAMVALAPHMEASFTSFAFDAELLLMAELAGIAAWLGLRWREV